MTIVLWIAGVTLALVGLTLAAWALFGDRSRTRRCRGCWYSMEGIPGLTCPECGWQASRERVLTKPRRRWRLCALALALPPLAAIGMCVAMILRDPQGTAACAPGWLLAEVCGWTDSPVVQAEVTVRIDALPAVNRQPSRWERRLCWVCAGVLKDSRRFSSHQWAETTLVRLARTNDAAIPIAQNLMQCDDDNLRQVGLHVATQATRWRGDRPDGTTLMLIEDVACRTSLRLSSSEALDILVYLQEAEPVRRALRAFDDAGRGGEAFHVVFVRRWMSLRAADEVTILSEIAKDATYSDQMREDASNRLVSLRNAVRTRP
jgi:hypothetical protein